MVFAKVSCHRFVITPTYHDSIDFYQCASRIFMAISSIYLEQKVNRKMQSLSRLVGELADRYGHEDEDVKRLKAELLELSTQIESSKNDVASSSKIYAFQYNKSGKQKHRT
jgi:hypothetical protein